MNTILMSIRPEYLVKILNHDKTIEVRKHIPQRFKPPFKVVMYCTKSNNCLYRVSPTEKKQFHILNHLDKRLYDFSAFLNGKVVGEFICDKAECIGWKKIISHTDKDYDKVTSNFERLLKLSCLTADEWFDYSNDKDVFALHISNVVAYDKPKEIGEFNNLIRQSFTSSPQSWVYCEDATAI